MHLDAYMPCGQSIYLAFRYQVALLWAATTPVPVSFPGDERLLLLTEHPLCRLAVLSSAIVKIY